MTHPAQPDIETFSPAAPRPRGTRLACVLPRLLDHDPLALVSALDHLRQTGSHPELLTALRLALLQPGRPTTWYQSLLNCWDDLGRPPLKPNSVRRRVHCLANFTAEPLIPLIRAAAAPFGVDLEIETGSFDAIEATALSPSEQAEEADYVVLLLSEHWLQRHVGFRALLDAADVARTADVLEQIVSRLAQRASRAVLVSNFSYPGAMFPGGCIQAHDRLGWTAAINRINTALADQQGDRVAVLDVASALHVAGGGHAQSLTNFDRARIPFEAGGSIAIAREIALSVASLCGRTHRALVTDLDNTIWGGEVGEAGPFGVVCSQDDVEGFGYWQLQQMMRSLPALGVAIAAASKNSPDAVAAFDQNADLPLRRSDFSSMQVSWEPKSRSIAKIATELGFGPEYMVFMDDNIFELAEVLSQHPHIDVLLAGPDPVQTRQFLSSSRFFHSVQVTKEDLARRTQFASRQAARALRVQFTDYAEYLDAINIRIEAKPYGEDTRRRIVQLHQKSNQFNLTTRRHGEQEVEGLIVKGATVQAFSYEDSFGPQGIIAAVVLVPETSALRIDSWVMSCRVLERTVEQAILEWILLQARGKLVIGEFIATEKNGIVRDLFSRLGFTRIKGEEADDHQRWIFDYTCAAPAHHVTMIDGSARPLQMTQ